MEVSLTCTYSDLQTSLTVRCTNTQGTDFGLNPQVSIDGVPCNEVSRTHFNVTCAVRAGAGKSKPVVLSVGGWLSNILSLIMQQDAHLYITFINIQTKAAIRMFCFHTYRLISILSSHQQAPPRARKPLYDVSLLLWRQQVKLMLFGLFRLFKGIILVSLGQFLLTTKPVPF